MKGFQCNSSSEMDKFFCDLEVVLEQYNHDVTALDDYEVASQFVHKQGSALPLYILYFIHFIPVLRCFDPVCQKVEVDFIRSIISPHFEQQKTKVVTVIDINGTFILMIKSILVILLILVMMMALILKVISVNDIHVFDGPHASAISSSLSVR